MQELHNAVMHEADSKDDFKSLLETSIKWAEYTLRNNEGDTLGRGLDISKALAEYHFELVGEDERLFGKQPNNS